MQEQIVKISWILAALFVLLALVSKFLGLDLMNVQNNINYFHAANTALLFGILFALQKKT
jgi:cytochrome c-type biogenesis protein CcmE